MFHVDELLYHCAASEMFFEIFITVVITACVVD